MLRVKALRVALFIGILLPSRGWAQKTEAAAFEVKYEGQTVTINVTRTSPLSELLEAFCQTTHSQCDGTRTASELVVAPMTFIGPWEKIVAALLDGTQLNYSSMAPSSSGSGSLVIQGRASQISSPPASPAPVETIARQDTDPSAQMVATVSDDSSNGQGKNVAASATLPPADVAPPIAFSPDSSGGMMDSHGLPVTISSGPAIEAMPDRAGSPIPVSTGGPMIEPMHDRNGNAIPVVIESQSYEPMPDKSGNLIPVIVPRRH